MRVNEVYEMIAARGVEILLHVPIVGGGDMFPTLKTLDEVVANTPAKIAVWINQKNGRVEYQGKTFEESDRYERTRPAQNGRKIDPKRIEQQALIKPNPTKDFILSRVKANCKLAEREGFEPSKQVTPLDGLASRCIRPLCHLSVMVVRCAFR